MKTLGELLRPRNDYERLIADHVLARHDAALEAAIAGHQRSVADCLKYVAGCAAKKRGGRNCVVMSDGEVYGLAVHWFLDGDTPTEIPGAGVDAAPGAGAAPKKAAKKKAATEKRDMQLCFDLFGDAL